MLDEPSDSDSSLFSTSNVQEAAWLQLRGFRTTTYRMVGGGLVEFAFRDSPALRMELRKWNGPEARDFREFAATLDATFRLIKQLRSGGAR